MRFTNTSSTYAVTDELREELTISKGTGRLIEIKPYRDGDSTISDNVEMYRAFASNLRFWNGFNVSPTNSFELWYDGEAVRLFMYIEDEKEFTRSIKHIMSNFPGVRITIPSEGAPNGTLMPDLRDGDHVAASTFSLANHYYEPIRNPSGVTSFVEPYRNIIEDMVDEGDVREMVQILFRPAGTNWTTSWYDDCGSYAEALAEDRVVPTKGGLDEEQSSAPTEAKQAVANIKSQIGQPGFHIAVRVVCISSDPAKATSQLSTLGQSFSDYYREWTGQTFVSNQQRGEYIRELLHDVIAREGDNMDLPRTPLGQYRLHKRIPPSPVMLMTFEELAGLAHIPNGTKLPTNAIDWEVLDERNRLPPTSPRFENDS
jgi:hypothetical protein